MAIPWLNVTSIDNSNGVLLARIIWWIILCIYAGRHVGKTVDIQYREAEGKPRFYTIPENRKCIFHFRYFTGKSVVKEGVIIQLVGYVFSFLEFVTLFLAYFSNELLFFSLIGEWLVIIFVLIIVVVLLPMALRYQKNINHAYDCDWITVLQENLTIYPKRRCRIISQTGDNVYVIVLSRWGRKKRLAKSFVPVVVGSIMYAVHSNEQGSPFWTIKNH